MIQPQNGTKTHALTAHALAGLRDIVSCPVPRQAVNAGVANRLLRGGLVASVQMKSPYKTHKGALIEHLTATPAGIEAAKQGRPA